MTTCYIGIGSNLGDRRGYIDKAIGMIGSSDDIKVARISSIYETDPVGGVQQGRFLNGVIELETTLSARGLLDKLINVENALGRTRSIKNGPRTIDLDILYYGDFTLNEKDLIIPHPRIMEREFVLRGLKELGTIRGVDRIAEK